VTAARSDNEFAQANRAAKAAALVLAVEELFSTLRIDSLALATVKGWGASDWAALAKKADVNRPSETTQRLVVALLEKRAARRAAE
jgi:hypothetical protein